MKVGTDGVLLGAWVSLEACPNTILDIGAGTGLIALQLAQRSNAASIDAIEIDDNAFEQCVTNFENSDWGDRLFCYHASFQEFVEELTKIETDASTKVSDQIEDGTEKYDLIISNPPFYSEDYKTENTSKNLARFSEALPFSELIEGVSKLLSESGTFALILPRNEEEKFIQLAAQFGLLPKRICRVRGSISSEEKRSLMEFSFHTTETVLENLTIEISRHVYTEPYRELVKDFYLNL